MRLAEWRTGTHARTSMTAKVLAVVEPVLVALGWQPQLDCWVDWGDDPTSRYSILVPTQPGLVVCNVRVNAGGEGPRASAKLVRWGRVQLGELAVETQRGRRLLSFQVEGLVLRGVDADADRVAAFALGLIAAADGRSWSPPATAARTRARKATMTSSASGGRTKRLPAGESARASRRTAT